jgi:hypothetical protein
MNRTRAALFIFLAFSLSLSLAAQQTSTTSPQPLVLLQRSLSALGGAQTLTDVTLSGTARRIAGSDDDTGPAVFKALASGAGRTDLSLSSGQHSEVSNPSAAAPAGTWSGPDRISHPIAFHNLLSEPAWFFPAFAIARRLSGSGSPVQAGYVATYIGHETHNGQAVEHLSVSQTSPVPNPPGGFSFEHLTQVDFFLDSTTYLPAAISFNIHPDNNALLDIPVEIRFSDYRPVASSSGSGLATNNSPLATSSMVPFHVQKFLNNGLLLDFQAQTVTFNSGLSPATFTVQ